MITKVEHRLSCGTRVGLACNCPETKVEPTAGAIKAAIALRKEISGKSIWAQMFIDGQGCNDKHDRIIQTTAELIDRETAASEMLKALERCVTMLQDEHRGYHGEVFVYDEPKACCEMGNAIVGAQNAIRKARGE